MSIGVAALIGACFNGDDILAGVVDPKKVTRAALQNAASIAALLLTTECLVTEIAEKDLKSASQK